MSAITSATASCQALKKQRQNPVFMVSSYEVSLYVRA